MTRKEHLELMNTKDALMKDIGRLIYDLNVSVNVPTAKIKSMKGEFELAFDEIAQREKVHREMRDDPNNIASIGMELQSTID